MCYVICEMGGTIEALAYTPASGVLRLVCSVPTLKPAGSTNAEAAAAASSGGAANTAHVLCSADGRFVYGSNRSDSTIVCYAVDPAAVATATPHLQYVGHFDSGGDSPRNFVLHPNGRWMLVANENTGNIVVFAIDQATGALSKTAYEVGGIPTAMCLVFVEAGLSAGSKL